ncbi:MAG TPA: DUF2155 domain-containing protein [Xanthobacteraceae bacterium]|nr:DUF2155 domain-containing protein [Xanthobacteraceae bacterium]
MKPLGLVTAAVGLLFAVPAAAQFGTIFGSPPRPPADVPSRAPSRPYPAPPPQALPPPLPPEEADQEPAPPPLSGPSSSDIRTQPLPPPPGTAPPDTRAPVQQGALPPGAPPVQTGPAPPGLPPGQRQPRGTPQPADTSPQPGDEVVTEAPSIKIANPTAVFSGLDKITGRIISFDVALNETVQFGALQVTPRACYSRPPTEPARTDAFVEVDEVTLQGEIKRIFEGWMFAASPGLHAVEHPIYDVWLTDCKGGSTNVAGAPATADASAKPPATPRAAHSRSTPRAPAPQRPVLRR